MINLLIVDDSMIFVKKLISIILKREENIKLIDIANNGEEALKILNETKIDIILLDLKMQKMDGITLIKNLECSFDNKYNNSIIVITGDSNSIGNVIKSSLVYDYILKPFNKDILLSKIHNLVLEKISNQNDKNLDNKILKQLYELGYNKTHLGTIYIKDCIKIDLIKYHGEAENINKQIYPILSEKYKKPIFLIKNNIIKATDYMYNESEMTKIMKYFKFDVDCKPTPKNVIKTVISKI